jgi:hypothetical protein
LKRDKTKTNNGNVLIVDGNYAQKNISNTNILCNVIKQEIGKINKSNMYIMINKSFSSYGVSDKAIIKLNNENVTFKKMHKVKKSDFNKAFKYAKQQKLYKGKISYKKANMKIRQVK